jgi:hypothetical protein
MTWIGEGADVATMVTGLSAATAAYLWTRNQFRGWREAKADRAYRYWNGYIIRGMPLTAFVRLVPDPDGPRERVTLDVINPDKTPNPLMAQGLRQIIESDGMISRSPSAQQREFLNDLSSKRFGPMTGYPVE